MEPLLAEVLEYRQDLWECTLWLWRLKILFKGGNNRWHWKKLVWAPPEWSQGHLAFNGWAPAVSPCVCICSWWTQHGGTLHPFQADETHWHDSATVHAVTKAVEAGECWFRSPWLKVKFKLYKCCIEMNNQLVFLLVLYSFNGLCICLHQFLTKVPKKNENLCNLCCYLPVIPFM